MHANLSKITKLEFFIVVSDKDEYGTTYIYGPFESVLSQEQFMRKHESSFIGRIIHKINSYAFIDPNQ